MTLRKRLDPIVLSIALGLAGLLVAFDPATNWWFPSCPFHALTGWLCPLCGSLRALHALLAGAPLVALALNPLTTLGVAVAVVAFAHDLLRPTEAPQIERLMGLCFSKPALAIAIVFGVFRNLQASVGWGF